jgi:hypothetical protein
MVATSSVSAQLASDAAATAIRKPGSFGANRRSSRMTASEPAAMVTVATSRLGIARTYATHFAMKSAGTASICSPSRSFTWLEKITSAIPAVKPVMTGCGMYLIHVPSLSRPAATRIRPASRVASSNPSYP